MHLALISPEERQTPAIESYVQLGRDTENGILDFVLVGGDLRDHCMAAALDLLHPGGLLTIYNVERYFPRETLHAVPNARRPENGCESTIWSDVEAAVKNWRRIWTTNCVTKTAICAKPYRGRQA